MIVRDIFIRLGLQDGGMAAKLAQAGRAGDLGTHSSCHAVHPIAVSGQDFVFEV